MNLSPVILKKIILILTISYITVPAQSQNNSLVSSAYVIQKYFKKHKIYPNSSAVKLIKIYNPKLRNDSINTKYKIAMPHFPKPNKEIKKYLNNNFSSFNKSDSKETRKYISNVDTFLNTARHFINGDFPTDKLTGTQDLYQLNNKLELLQKILSSSKSTASKTKKSRLYFLNQELTNLNFKMKSAYDLYNLDSLNFSMINNLAVSITDNFFTIDIAKRQSKKYSISANNNNLEQLNTIYSEELELSYFFSNSDATKFNMYVYRIDSITEKRKEIFEESMYEVWFVKPLLEKDSAAWTKIGGLASTNSFKFPPAKFIFKINKSHNSKIESYSTEDLTAQQIDDIKKSGIFDWLSKRPYKLIFDIK